MRLIQKWVLNPTTRNAARGGSKTDKSINTMVHMVLAASSAGKCGLQYQSYLTRKGITRIQRPKGDNALLRLQMNCYVFDA